MDNKKSPTKLAKAHWSDIFLEYFFRFAASGKIPANWFLPTVPSDSEKASNSGHLSLELVSHCWNYAYLLDYQLSSLVNYPPTKLDLTVTIFYSTEDEKTVAMLDFFGKKEVTNVTWNWQELPKEMLFRRSIGRNKAALATKADWIWFTDCDLVFHEQCLDSLADAVQGRKDALLYPQAEHITTLLAEDDPILVKGAEPQLLDIDTNTFSVMNVNRATGPLQITHGDVARSCGYCNSISIYQKPAKHWCKAYEDRAFRWLLRSQGVGIDIPNVFRIQHIFKGRYKEGTLNSAIRRQIKRLKSI